MNILATIRPKVCPIFFKHPLIYNILASVCIFGYNLQLEKKFYCNFTVISKFTASILKCSYIKLLRFNKICIRLKGQNVHVHKTLNSGKNRLVYCTVPAYIATDNKTILNGRDHKTRATRISFWNNATKFFKKSQKSAIGYVRLFTTGSL